MLEDLGYERAGSCAEGVGGGEAEQARGAGQQDVKSAGAGRACLRVAGERHGRNTGAQHRGHAGAGPDRLEESGLQHAEIDVPGDCGLGYRADHSLQESLPCRAPVPRAVPDKRNRRLRGRPSQHFGTISPGSIRPFRSHPPTSKSAWPHTCPGRRESATTRGSPPFLGDTTRQFRAGWCRPLIGSPSDSRASRDPPYRSRPAARMV